MSALLIQQTASCAVHAYISLQRADLQYQRQGLKCPGRHIFKWAASRSAVLHASNAGSSAPQLVVNVCQSLHTLAVVLATKEAGGAVTHMACAQSALWAAERQARDRGA